MNRLAGVAILGLLYVVAQSKRMPECFEVQGMKAAILVCDKNMAEDLAMALEMGRDRRVLTLQDRIDAVVQERKAVQMKLDQQGACTENDCGKKP